VSKRQEGEYTNPFNPHRNPKAGPLQRTDLTDTRLEAHRKLIAMLRKMTPEERIRHTFELMESTRRLRQIAREHERPSDRSDV
jgi:hypothetical protein